MSIDDGVCRIDVCATSRLYRLCGPDIRFRVTDCVYEELERRLNWELVDVSLFVVSKEVNR